MKLYDKSEPSHLLIRILQKLKPNSCKVSANDLYSFGCYQFHCLKNKSLIGKFSQYINSNVKADNN